MLPKADLTVKEVQTPHGRWCKSGHEAPATFDRDGPSGGQQPTKFFKITSQYSPEVNGVYCEPCLVIANAMKRGEVTLKPR